MENEGIGERIKQARKKRNLTQFELAGIMGYNHSTAIASWENSKRNPSIPTIRKLAQALEINIDWLKTGEGEMLDTLTYNEQIRPLTISTNNVKLKEVGTVKAGYFASVDILGEDNTHDYPVNQLPSYAQNLSVEQMQARFFVFFVKGDSMYPTLEEGDKLIVERCEDLTKFKVGDIVIAANEDYDIVVKRLEKINGEFTLKSDNPEYETIKLKPNAKAMGWVLNIIRAYRR